MHRACQQGHQHAVLLAGGPRVGSIQKVGAILLKQHYVSPSHLQSCFHVPSLCLIHATCCLFSQESFVTLHGVKHMCDMTYMTPYMTHLSVYDTFGII